MKNERIKFFKKYINDNIDSWCKKNDLEGSLGDIIDFSIFLLEDSKIKMAPVFIDKDGKKLEETFGDGLPLYYTTNIKKLQGKKSVNAEKK